jgi:hypothetical protein
MMPDLQANLTDSQKINLNIITLNTAVNDLQTDVKELDKIITKGNGDLPLRETVRNHTAIINEWKHWIKFFIGLLITQALAVLGGIIFTFIKVMPLLERLANQP